MSAPFRAVVDASVAVKLFVPEALSDEAHAVFARLHAEPPAQFVVPGLFFVECANVFRTWTRRFAYAPEQARRDLDALLQLDFYVLPAQALVPAALRLTLERDLTAYDALYAAAAAATGAPLITADARLAERLSPTSIPVRRLDEFAG